MLSPVPSRARSQRRSAFTLIELIVVLVIVGIIGALAIPAFQAVKDRARANTAEKTALALYRSAEGLAALADSTDVGAYLDEAAAELPAGSGVTVDEAAGTIDATVGDVCRSLDVATLAFSDCGALPGGGGGGGGDPYVPLPLALNVTTLAGDNYEIWGAAVDTQGNVYKRQNVSTDGGVTLCKINKWAGANFSVAPIEYATGIPCNNGMITWGLDGKLYMFTSAYSNSIYRINADGTSTQVGTAINYTAGIVGSFRVDTAGRVWLGTANGSAANALAVYNPATQTLQSIVSSPIAGAAWDVSGDLWTVSTDATQVNHYDVSAWAGTDVATLVKTINATGLNATVAEGIAVDQTGKVWFSTWSSYLYAFDPTTDTLTTPVGSGTAGVTDGQGAAAQVDSPVWLLMDWANDRLLFSEANYGTNRAVA